VGRRGALASTDNATRRWSMYIGLGTLLIIIILLVIFVF
jgi:hypothetical protein